MKSRHRIIFNLALGALLFAPLTSLDAGIRYPKTDPSRVASRHQIKRLPGVPGATLKKHEKVVTPKTVTEVTTPVAKPAQTPRKTSSKATATAAAPAAPTKTIPADCHGPELEPAHKAQAARTAAAMETAAQERVSEQDKDVPSAKPAAEEPANTQTANGADQRNKVTVTDDQTDSKPRAQTPSPTDVAPKVNSSVGTAKPEPAAAEQQPATAKSEPRNPASQSDAGTSAAKPAPPAPKRRFTAAQLRLRDKVRGCLRYYYQRSENISAHSPWGIMHCLIGYGVDTEIIAGNRRVNAIGWLCWNQPCRGMQMLDVKNDRVEPRTGPGYQGHEGQFLAMLALSRVPIDYALRIDGKDLTIADLVKYEMATCKPRSELSFKLIGLSHYLKSDVTWTSQGDEKWSISRLIQDEITQPIKGACCGGTHRLMGLSTAVRTRQRRNEPMSGQWLRAQNFARNYQNYAFKLQNRDGSFSTDWFKRRADSGDMDRKLQTTGHILEWLVYSLPEEQLGSARVVRSVNFLANLMITQRRHEWEIGPRGHALRALALYNERRFGDKPGQRRMILTGHTTN